MQTSDYNKIMAASHMRPDTALVVPLSDGGRATVTPDGTVTVINGQGQPVPWPPEQHDPSLTPSIQSSSGISVDTVPEAVSQGTELPPSETTPIPRGRTSGEGAGDNLPFVSSAPSPHSPHTPEPQPVGSGQVSSTLSTNSVEEPPATTRHVVADTTVGTATVPTPVSGVDGKPTVDSVGGQQSTPLTPHDPASTTTATSSSERVLPSWITNKTAPETVLDESVVDSTVARLAMLEAEHEVTVQRLERVRQERDDNVARVTDLSNQLAQAQASHDSLTATIDQLRDDLTRVQAVVESSVSMEQAASLESDIRLARQREEDTANAFEQAQAAWADTERSLQTRIQDLVYQLDMATSERDQARRNADEARVNAERAEIRAQHLTELVGEADEKERAAREALNTLKTTMATQASDATSEKVAQLEQDLTVLESEYAELQTRCDRAVEAEKAAREEGNEYLQQILTLQTERDSALADLETARAELADMTALRDTAEEQKQTLQETITGLEKDRDEYRSQAQYLEEHAGEEWSDYEDVKTELTTVKEDRERLQGEVVALTEERDAALSKAVLFQTGLEEAQRAEATVHSDHAHAIAERDTRIESLTAQNTEHEATIASLRARLDAAPVVDDTRVGELEESVRATTARADSLQHDLERAQARIHELESHIEQLTVPATTVTALPGVQRATFGAHSASTPTASTPEESDSDDSEGDRSPTRALLVSSGLVPDSAETPIDIPADWGAILHGTTPDDATDHHGRFAFLREPLPFMLTVAGVAVLAGSALLLAYPAFHGTHTGSEPKVPVPSLIAEPTIPALPAEPAPDDIPTETEAEAEPAPEPEPTTEAAPEPTPEQTEAPAQPAPATTQAAEAPAQPVAEPSTQAAPAATVNQLSTDVASANTRVTFTVRVSTTGPLTMAPTGTISGQTLTFMPATVNGTSTFTTTIDMPAGHHDYTITAGQLTNTGSIDTM